MEEIQKILNQHNMNNYLNYNNGGQMYGNQQNHQQFAYKAATIEPTIN